MDVFPKAHLEQGHTLLMLPKNCDSSTCSSVSGDEGVCEVVLTQKIKALELQDIETNHNSETKHLALETSCLLTPPNTPLSSESRTECQDMQSHHHTPQSCETTKHEEGEEVQEILEKISLG